MVRIVCVAVLVTLVARSIAVGQGWALGDKSFDDITHKQIKTLVENAKIDPTLRLDGSDSKDNQIPAGTILVYVTSDNRFGKLRVVECGYDLKVNWVTYAKDGGEFSRGDALVVRGTWTCDLDQGREGREGTEQQDDFWWQQQTDVIRFLRFCNGATFVVFPNELG